MHITITSLLMVYVAYLLQRSHYLEDRFIFQFASKALKLFQHIDRFINFSNLSAPNLYFLFQFDVHPPIVERHSFIRIKHTDPNSGYKLLIGVVGSWLNLFAHYKLKGHKLRALSRFISHRKELCHIAKWWQTPAAAQRGKGADNFIFNIIGLCEIHRFGLGSLA